MRLSYRILNVFTVGGERLSGNPLCVFEDGRGLDAPTMQALARQMNLSETTFILPSERADARVRIFTPTIEMPFAGHPTLGTASVVGGERERVVLEMGAGRVEVERSAERWTLRAAQAPAARAPEATRAELARMLALPEEALAGDARWVSVGTEQLVIPIASAEHVRAARPDPALLARHAMSPARNEAMAYLVSEDTDPWTVRFFFTANGAVLEDPATGSACANLGGYLLLAGRPRPLRATLQQGAQVGRPSRLHLEVDEAGGIFVGGEVIELGRGVIEL